jgi:galactose mutarotase-like enzyme
MHHPLGDRIAINETTIDGFAAVVVDTGALALTIVPELGGKIASLRDLRSGREWLWRHPRMPYRRVAPGASYVAEADTGGWDECFPTVAPCAYPSAPWAGTALPDHGELWSQPAALVVAERDGGVALRAAWRGAALPYRFERSIALAAGASTLRVEYAAQNQSDAPIQFIWCIHPLLAIEPGMALLVPPSAHFNCWSTFPPDLLGQAQGLRYPPEARAGEHAIDLATLPEPSAGVALKLWSDPLDQGWAAVRARDGELRMRWDVALLPQVALWMNLGAWAGDGGTPYYNLGLEPCIGAQDSLAQAVSDRHLFATLPPHGSRAWWLEIELAAG